MYLKKKQKLLDEREEAVVQVEARWSTIIERVHADVEASKEIVFIEAREIEFKLSKAKLLKLGNTYFKGLLTFNPVREGSRYFLDRYSNSINASTFIFTSKLFSEIPMYVSNYFLI